ncbi:MAG: hypothetical protein ABJL67_01180 [Sulfitobacter sp.]
MFFICAIPGKPEELPQSEFHIAQNGTQPAVTEQSGRPSGFNSVPFHEKSQTHSASNAAAPLWPTREAGRAVAKTGSVKPLVWQQYTQQFNGS